MLNRERLLLAIDIQSRSYQLLRWIGRAIENGFIPIERAAKHSETPDAAFGWISDNAILFPKELQPDRAHIHEFANFFWTYITTSFDVDPNPEKRLEPGTCGCTCLMCARISRAAHLRPKKLSHADKRRAVDLMVDRLVTLGSEEGIVVDSEKIRPVVLHADTRQASGFSTYGYWLINRLNGITDGPSILALWREIAWNRTGSPIQGFKLQYDDFVNAEETLIRTICKVPGPSH